MAVFGVLLVAIVAAYFLGGAIERAAAVRGAAAEEKKFAAAETHLASVRSNNALLSADIWAYRAATALDERNFGLANDAVGNATAGLRAVDAVASGIDPAALKAVQTETGLVKISVATNLEAQRSQLLHLAADITALTAMKSGPTD